MVKSLQKIILAGGSGFLGQSFAYFLAKRGFEVVILSRQPKSYQNPQMRTVVWDAKTIGNWATELEDAVAVVNFTGRSVACLYTEKNKKEIIASRIDSVRVIAKAFGMLQNPPPVLIQAASLAIYGDTKTLCDEDAPHGSGFSTEFSVAVCEKWEQAFWESKPAKVRAVLFRIGFVLGPGGGALEPLARLTRLFLGGTVGSGRQFISWLHLHDLNRMFLWAIENPHASGVYNATGPNPVENREFMATLRKVLKRPWSPPVPEFIVKFGALFIVKADPSLALTGRKCVSRRLEEQGFRFEYTDLENALKEILC